MKNFLKKIIIKILSFEAKLILKKYKPKIIAVTGNVGKTSAKDAIYSILSHSYYVRKSEKSFNSEIGIPLTILGVQNAWSNPFMWVSNIIEGLALILTKNHYPKCLVIEIGADSPGLIESICLWMKPDMVVVTKIGEIPVHIEIFKTAEKLIKEKASLVDALSKDGTLILNKDDENTMSLKGNYSGQVMTFGFSTEATIFASNERILYDKYKKPVGINFKVNYASSIVPVKIIGSLGFHGAQAVLAAFSIAILYDINLVSATEWVSGYKTPNGRLNIIKGYNDSTILDDTYNSSPAALKAALLTLDDIKNEGRKIAILGDMLELGKYSADAHIKMGELASRVCDVLFIVGTRAQKIATGAENSGMKKKNIKTFNNAKEAGKYLKTKLEKNDVVLVKGSQGMRMEQTVEKIMENPEDKSRLLVRQESEWLAKI